MKNDRILGPLHQLAGGSSRFLQIFCKIRSCVHVEGKTHLFKSLKDSPESNAGRARRNAISSRHCNPGDPLSPVLAPDGHQVTWGEWTDVEGQAAVKCIKQGSHIVLHLSGLIPNGQYTAWVVAFDPPGFNGNTLANAFTFGPL